MAAQDFFQIVAQFPNELDRVTSVNPDAPYLWRCYADDNTANTYFKLSHSDDFSICCIHCKEFGDDKVITISRASDDQHSSEWQMQMQQVDHTNEWQKFKVLIPPPCKDQSSQTMSPDHQPPGVVAIYSANRQYVLVPGEDFVKPVPVDTALNPYRFIFQ